MSKEKLTDEQIVKIIDILCTELEVKGDGYLLNIAETAEIIYTQIVEQLKKEINRLKEENKKYERVTDTLNKQLKQENAELKAENERLNKLFEYTEPTTKRVKNVVDDIKRKEHKETAEKILKDVQKKITQLRLNGHLSREQDIRLSRFLVGKAQDYEIEVEIKE